MLQGTVSFDTLPLPVETTFSTLLKVVSKKLHYLIRVQGVRFYAGPLPGNYLQGPPEGSFRETSAFPCREEEFTSGAQTLLSTLTNATSPPTQPA